MRALVSGACGFAGRHLVALLQAEGMQVHPFDPCVDCDVRDYEQVRGCLEQLDPDYVFHLAALAAPPENLTDTRRAIDVNLLGTYHLLEAARQVASRARIHLAGTSEEIGYWPQAGPVTEETCRRPTQPYGVTKLAASELGLAYARHHGLHVVVTRAFNHTGPGAPARYAASGFARRVVEFERGRVDAVPVGNLDARRNLSDVRDVVAAYRAAVDQPAGSVFLVCGDWNPTMAEVLGVLTAFSARQPVKVRVEERLWRQAELGPFPEPSHQLLSAATGWEPTIPPHRTLRDLFDGWRARG